MTETPRTYQMTTDLPDETNDLLTDCEAAAEDKGFDPERRLGDWTAWMGYGTEE